MLLKDRIALVTGSSRGIGAATAKASLNMMSHSLANEVDQYGIRVNTVAPGLILTDATSWMPEERKQMQHSLIQ